MVRVLRNLLKLCVPLPTVPRGIVTAFIILKHMPRQFFRTTDILGWSLQSFFSLDAATLLYDRRGKVHSR